MADEPTLGELSRRIDGLTSMLAQLVTRAEFSAEQRLVERRFSEIEGDVGDVRRALLSEVTGLRTALEGAVARLEAADEKREDKRGSNLRQMVYAGLIPAVLVVLSTVINIWMTTKGS
ncbi:hypothetical protein ACIBEJ_34260 [Nonomuraea sp. NPDC050790]|uniref:hypothetical protein n=1 Tax=Nonomuraea sp. NPDC050790 TaxID=3364371 RepID=UPI0037B9EBFB